MSIVPDAATNSIPVLPGELYNVRIYRLGERREGVLLYKPTRRKTDAFGPKQGRRYAGLERTGDEKMEAAQKASRRAGSSLRRRCEANGCDALYTLTMDTGDVALSRTRLVNRLGATTVDDFCDREVFDYYVRLFLKRLRRVKPGFKFAKVYEPHKRGVYHLHLATPEYMSGGELRRLWGYGFVKISLSSRVRKGQATRAGCERVGSYLAKYLGKSFDAADIGTLDSEAGEGVEQPSSKSGRAEGKHRYSCSQNMKLPFDEYLIDDGDVGEFETLLEEGGYRLEGDLFKVENGGRCFAIWGRSRKWRRVPEAAALGRVGRPANSISVQIVPMASPRLE